jgi:hypothetical protein
MDENGVETDGIDWCHIYFLDFSKKVKNAYRKYRNKYENRYCQKQI